MTAQKTWLDSWASNRSKRFNDKNSQGRQLFTPVYQALHSTLGHFKIALPFPHYHSQQGKETIMSQRVTYRCSGWPQVNEYISHKVIYHLQERFNTGEMGHLEAVTAKKEGSPKSTWVADLVSNVLSKIPEAILELWEGTPRYLKCLEAKDLKNPFCPLSHSLKATSSEKSF